MSAFPSTVSPRTHDRVRAVPGCFQKAIASIKAVTALREQFPNLTVFVNSVILHENYAELPALADYLLQEVDLDTHYFNIIRGDPMNPAQRDVPHEALARLYQEYERILKPSMWNAATSGVAEDRCGGRLAHLLPGTAGDL